MISSFEILALRTAKEQLAHLSGDKSAENFNHFFSAFVGVNPLHYNPYTDSQWRTRVEQFESNIEPYAKKILPDLRGKFKMKDLSAQQVSSNKRQSDVT